MIDTNDEKTVLYFVSPTYAVNKLCTRTDIISPTKAYISGKGEESFVGLMNKRGNLYGITQTIIGELFVRVIGPDMNFLTSLSSR